MAVSPNPSDQHTQKSSILHQQLMTQESQLLAHQRQQRYQLQASDDSNQLQQANVPLPATARTADPERSSPLRLARKRRRPALSCVACRRRKVRCDREEPCGPCRRMGHPAACVYVAHHHHSPVSEPSSVQLTSSVPRPLTAFYDPVRQPASPPGAQHASSHSPPASSSDNTAASTIERLQRRVVELQDALDRSRTLQNRYDTQDPNHVSEVPLHETVKDLAHRLREVEQRTNRQCDETKSPDLYVASVLPLLKVSTNTTRTWGATHYIHLLDKRSYGFKDILKDKSQNPDVYERLIPTTERRDHKHESHALQFVNQLAQLRKARRHLKQPLSMTRAWSLSEAVESLPPEQRCWEVVRAYLHTIEPLFRVLHVPTFWRECEAYIPRLSHAPADFLAMLLLIITIGGVFVEDVKTHRSCAARWIFAAQAWVTGPQEKSLTNTRTTQVWCLLVLARHITSVGTKEQTSILAAGMLQDAFAAGLNRDIVTSDMNMIQMESRRRLWATTLELSYLISSDADVAPVVQKAQYDTKPPANYDDQDLDEERLSKTCIPRSEQVTSDTSVQLMLHRSYETRLEAAHFSHELNPHHSYNRALELTDTLRSCIEAAESFFDPARRSGQYHQPNWSEPSQLHKYLILNCLWTAILRIHQPFILAARSDPRFFYSRQISSEAAMNILSSQLDLDPAKRGPLSDVSRVTLFGRGLYRSALSLNAITVLTQEVMAQLDQNRHLSHASTSLAERRGLDTYGTAGAPSCSAMAQITRAACEPMIKRLDHARQQSRFLIMRGTPSCKRYGFLSTMLALIDARHRGERGSKDVHAAVQECLADCERILSEQTHEFNGELPRNGTAAIGKFVAVNDVDVQLTGSCGNDPSETLRYDNLLNDLEVDFDPAWFLAGVDFEIDGIS